MQLWMNESSWICRTWNSKTNHLSLADYSCDPKSWMKISRKTGCCLEDDIFLFWGSNTHRRESGPLKNIALYGSRTPCRAIHSRGLFALGDRWRKKGKKRESERRETKRRPARPGSSSSFDVHTGPAAAQQTLSPFFFLLTCARHLLLSAISFLSVALFASLTSLSFHLREGQNFLPISCFGTGTLAAHHRHLWMDPPDGLE